MTDASGNTAIVCDQFQGSRLNSPNDVVVDSEGAIWFTDPTYGILTDHEGKRAKPEQSKNRVYRVDPVSGVTGEIDCLSMPNGLTFSPGGQTLYVADSGADLGPEIGFEPTGPRDVYAFSIGSDGHVAGAAKHVCTVRTVVPDGMRCDRDGNLWVATGEGLMCHAPDGFLVGCLATGRVASNLAFGGPDLDEVFVTTETSAYVISL
jgi:gluconolactonase